MGSTCWPLNVIVFGILSGAVRLRDELPDVHVLGSALLLPGRDPGQGLRSVRLWIWNTRGKKLKPGKKTLFKS